MAEQQREEGNIKKLLLQMQNSSHLKYAYSWPKEWSTQFNKGNPMKLYNPKDKFNYEVYISSSPAVFCPEGIFICFKMHNSI